MGHQHALEAVPESVKNDAIKLYTRTVWDIQLLHVVTTNGKVAPPHSPNDRAPLAYYSVFSHAHPSAVLEYAVHNVKDTPLSEKHILQRNAYQCHTL